MAALREQILATVAAVLTGTTGAGQNVFRARETSVTRAQTPAITVLFGGEQTQRLGQATLRHELTVQIAIFVRGDPWDQLATAVDEQVHRLLASSAPLAALLSDQVRLSADPESEEADRTAGALNVHYRMTYLTRVGDIALVP